MGTTLPEKEESIGILISVFGAPFLMETGISALSAIVYETVSNPAPALTFIAAEARLPGATDCTTPPVPSSPITGFVPITEKDTVAVFPFTP